MAKLLSGADRTKALADLAGWHEVAGRDAIAKTGDPNGSGLPRWTAFDAKRKAYLTFTAGGPAAGEGLRAEQCDLFLRAERERPTWQFPERASH